MGQLVKFGKAAGDVGPTVVGLEKVVRELEKQGELPPEGVPFILAVYILADGKMGMIVDWDDVVALTQTFTEVQLREMALQTQARNQN
jgi:hypothetical protein